MLWMGLKQRCGFSPTHRSSFKGWLMCTAPRQVPRHVPRCLAIQEIISSRTTSSVTDRLKVKPQYPACFATVALQGRPGDNFEDHTVHFSKTKWRPLWTLSTHKTTYLPVPVVSGNGQLLTEIQRWWGERKTIETSGSKGQELNILIWPLSWWQWEGEMGLPSPVTEVTEAAMLNESGTGFLNPVPPNMGKFLGILSASYLSDLSFNMINLCLFVWIYWYFNGKW